MGGVESSLTKLAIDQLLQSCHGISLIRAVNRYGNFCASANGQHHKAHDTRTTHSLIILFHRDICLEAAGNAHKLSGGPGMNTKLVLNGELFCNHSGEGLG